MGKASKTYDTAYPPLLMRSDRAAAYLDMSQNSFLRLVADGVFPAGTAIRGMVVWDRRDLETSWANIKQGLKAKPRNSINEILGIPDVAEADD